MIPRLQPLLVGIDRKLCGEYVATSVAGRTALAFVPPPLPPNPSLDLEALREPLSRAERALDRLEAAGRLLPQPDLLLYMYVRHEATLAAGLDDLHATMSELRALEGAAVAAAPFDDLRAASAYIEALRFGLRSLATSPWSVRLLCRLHARLMRRGRGATRKLGWAAGEIRRSQNWVAGTEPGELIFVPPPPRELGTCLADLEQFLRAPTPSLPPLIKAGLIHAQFLTLHPFLDGNGRLGRLLVPLILSREGRLGEPLLYLGTWLTRHRQEYHRLIQGVRERGAWEAWLAFFLTGVAETASSAADLSARVVALFAADQIRVAAKVGPRHPAILSVYEALRRSPLASRAQLAARAGLTEAEVAAALPVLERLGIVDEAAGRRPGQSVRYRSYLAILSDGVAAHESRIVADGIAPQYRCAT